MAWKSIQMHSRPWTLLKALYSPGRVFSKLVQLTPGAPFWLRCALDAFDRPHLAYGVVQAALQAKALGIDSIAVIEFGVGYGKRLLDLESLARQTQQHLGVRVQVYGFDLGTGLPAPQGYRDLAYLFKKGFYQIDAEALRAELSEADLFLGDLRETLPAFFAREDVPPVGFISVDLDYYHLTVDALHAIQTAQLERFLPRPFCYFNDVIGPDTALVTRFAGELLAIDEFNARNENRKLDTIYGLRHKRIASCFWAEKLHVLHLFEHPQYNTYIDSGKEECGKHQ